MSSGRNYHHTIGSGNSTTRIDGSREALMGAMHTGAGAKHHDNLASNNNSSSSQQSSVVVMVSSLLQGPAESQVLDEKRLPVRLDFDHMFC